MGRAKLVPMFIENKKTRNKTYEKRKNGLITKAQELSILCQVPLCIIIYPCKEGCQSSQPEVYSFKEGEEIDDRGAEHSDDPDCHVDMVRTKGILARYLEYPKEEKHKRASSLQNMFDEMKKKAQEELYMLRLKNAKAKYPLDSTNLGFSIDQLIDLFVYLNHKIKYVEQKIGMIKGANQVANLDYSVSDNTISHVTSCLVPSTNYNPFLVRCDHEMQHLNQFLPFDSSCTNFANLAMKPMAANFGENNNLVCNMNMMGYDQGPRFDINVPVAPSCGSGVPLHLPMLHRNNPLMKPYKWD